ncbi:hypothetical protein [Mycoplasma leonicaptivi]|uniref:hypothetical protein n=1 Tax=Mycoplasma leonicaptivi TaxID=36742 RepID=UPI0004896929|nr:hypothetical protein [Mycoplasma leonicaptivi]
MVSIEIIFWIIFGILLFLELILILILIKKIILKLINKKIPAKFQTLTQELYFSQSVLCNLLVVSRKSDQHSILYKDLNNIFNKIQNLYTNIEIQNKITLDSVLQKYFFKSIKNFFSFNKKNKKIKKVFVNFNYLSKDFVFLWKKIEQNQAFVLEKCHSIEKFLLKNKFIINNIFDNLVQKNNEIKQNLTLIDKNKYNGNFLKALELCMLNNNYLYNLTSYLNNVKKIHYLIFIDLNKKIINLKDFKKKYLMLINLNNSLLLNIDATKMNNLTNKIKDVYNEIENIEYQNEMKVQIRFFIYKNLHFLETELKNIKKFIEYNEKELSIKFIKNKFNQILKNFYFLIQNISKIEVCEYLNVIENIVFNLKQIKSNINICLLIKEYNQKINITQNNEVINVKILYKKIIENEFLPQDNSNLKLISKLKTEYLEYEKNNFREILNDLNKRNDFILNLVKLSKKIIINKKYFHLLNEIIEHISKKNLNDNNVYINIIDKNSILYKNKNYQEVFEFFKKTYSKK